MAVAAWLVVSPGCRGDEPPSGAALDGGSSSGAEAEGTTDDAPPSVCTPGEAQACYDGPLGTEGVGACAAGQARCAADGRGWLECEGQVLPGDGERCDTPQDDDCDGLAVCEPAVEWAHAVPGYVQLVAASDDGGVVLVGSDGYDDFEGEVLAGTFVVRLDASGQRQWSRSMGAGVNVWPNGLAVGPAGEVVVVGGFEGSPDLGDGPISSAFGVGAFTVRYAADGAFTWSHVASTEGYLAADIGPGGTTYAASGFAFGSEDPVLVGTQLHVVAVEDDGAVAWALPGTGSWANHTIAVEVVDGRELWLVALAGGPSLALGELAAPTDDYEPLLLRIGLDGTPLEARRLLDPLPYDAYDVQTFSRPGGLVVASTITELSEEGFTTGVLLQALDEAFAVQSQRFVAPNVWLHDIGPYPGGATLLSVDFSGLLSLGQLGVGTEGPAIAVVDDDGNARWAEVLHASTSRSITSTTATPDGAVLVAGESTQGAVLAGVALEGGAFVAKLRP